MEGLLEEDNLPASPDDELVERVARATAFWHGQKKVVAGETVAARHGYGSWGHSAEQYADAHWREYVEAARAAIAVVLEEAAKVFEVGGRAFLDEANKTLPSSQETRAILLETADRHFVVAATIRALNPKER